MMTAEELRIFTRTSKEAAVDGFMKKIEDRMIQVARAGQLGVSISVNIRMYQDDIYIPLYAILPEIQAALIAFGYRFTVNDGKYLYISWADEEEENK